MIDAGTNERARGDEKFLDQILVVDDSITVRAVVRHALEAAGYVVCEANNGEAAMAWLATHVPSLVISDVNMAPMDGLSLLRNIRKRFSAVQLPVLMLTTEASDELKSRGREAGATGWLVKPFDKQRMCAVVAHVIASRVGSAAR